MANAAGALVDLVNPPGEAPTMRRVVVAVSAAPSGTGFFDACVEIIIRGVAPPDA